MAIYDIAGTDQPDSGFAQVHHKTFVDWFYALSQNEQLAYADRVAAMARQLRKVVLDKTTVTGAVTAWGAHNTGATPTDLVPALGTDFSKQQVITAAVNVIRAANNDLD